MKIYDLPRGEGKTTRMIYASEFNNALIICLDECKRNTIMLKAQDLGAKIPNPITVAEIVSDDIVPNARYVLIDDCMEVLESLMIHKGLELIGVTLTSEE